MTYRAEEQKSLDLVQRWVVATLVTVVGGAPTTALAVYSAHLGLNNPTANAAGLAIMSAILGVITIAAVLLIHRRRGPWMMLLIVGLIPAGIAAYQLMR